MNASSNQQPDNEYNLWIRAAYMFVCALAFGLTETLVCLLAIINLVYRAFKDENNQNIVDFGCALGRYVQQLTNFMTFNTEQVPFPFDKWPGDQHRSNPTGEPNVK